MRLANTSGLFLFLLVLLSATARADEEIWQRLKQGAHVVLVRHAVTTAGAGDPPGMRLEDCSTQRNLSAQGRRQAEQWRKRAIPLERVLASPWCRCLETARLAFGKTEVSDALSNLFGRPENRERQVRELRALVDKHAGKGNLVLVTHGSTIAALTGINPATGEMVILAKGAVAGRLLFP